MKNEIKFSPAFFVPGTIVRAAFRHNHANDGVYEVKCAVRNGPQSWVIETTQAETGVLEGMQRSFHVDYVTEIVRFGNGTRAPGRFVDNPLVRKEDWLSIFRRMGHPEPKRARNKYRVYTHRELLHHLVDRWVGDHVINFELLTTLLTARGVLRFGGEYHWMLPVNKKKLKRAIRQLLPKCYVNARREQARQEKEDWADYVADLDYLDERDSNHDTQEGSCYDDDEHRPSSFEEDCSPTERSLQRHSEDLS